VLADFELVAIRSAFEALELEVSAGPGLSGKLKSLAKRFLGR